MTLTPAPSRPNTKAAPPKRCTALLEYIRRDYNLIALDVGAGSGRDAAWLASLGYEVVAAEPAAGMRIEAQRRHPDPRIRWLDDGYRIWPLCIASASHST